MIALSETISQILKKLPVLFLNNTELFDNFFPLFGQQGPTSTFSACYAVNQRLFGKIIHHVDQMPCRFVADADSFCSAAD